MSSLHSAFSISASSSSSSSQAEHHQLTISSTKLSAKPTTNKNKNTLHLNNPLLHKNLTTQIKEKILCLEIMGVDSGKALSKNSDLHSASLDSIHVIISFLHSKGIHHKDFPRIFGMCPQLLTSDVASHLSPVFSFLSDDLNVPDYKFRKIITKCPRLLTSDVDRQLRPNSTYLRDTIGFQQRQLETLIYTDPVLLVSNVENTLVPKLKYLEESVGLTEEEIFGMVRRFPSLLTFSVENNLKPKYEFFVGEMEGRELEEIKAFPHYFGFSLENQIKPRYLQVLDRGMMKMPLPLLLKTTDPQFQLLLSQSSSVWNFLLNVHRFFLALFRYKCNDLSQSTNSTNYWFCVESVGSQ